MYTFFVYLCFIKVYVTLKKMRLVYLNFAYNTSYI